MARQVRRIAPPTVERTIHFFRIHTGIAKSGRPRPFNADAVVQTLAALRGEDRYSSDRDDFVMSVVHRTASPQRVEFVRSRRNAMPRIDRLGDQRDLNLAADEGLAEASHVVFFPDNILGWEFNNYAPRPTRFAAYLLEKARSACPRELRFEALLRHDAADRLARLESIRTLVLKVRAPYVENMQGAATLRGSFQTALQASNAQTLTLELGPTPYSRDETLASRVLNEVRRLARRQDLRQGALKFDVAGTNDVGQRDVIDVLSDQLIAVAPIVKVGPRSRVVLPDSAYDAVESAYETLKSELRRAAAIS